MSGKLTGKQRDEMRRLHREEGWGYGRLAKRFGVHEQTACRVVNPEAKRRNQEALRRHHERKAAELARLRDQVARLTQAHCTPGAASARCTGAAQGP